LDLQAARDEICRIARDLFWMGLQSPRSGNLSVMLDDGAGFLITRRGSSFRSLKPDRDVITVEFGHESPTEASSEVAVHSAILQATSHRAVVHAHPPYAIALGFNSSLIRPIHNEGRAILGDVPVTVSVAVEGAGEDPAPIVGALRDRPAMVVRGHGAFCAAADLETAFYFMGVLEASCKIIHLASRSRPE
jgi:L-fuculose-phosphate aldolase